MQKPVICIGASLVDELYHAKTPMLLATTNDATIHRSVGGVSHFFIPPKNVLAEVFGEKCEGVLESLSESEVEVDLRERGCLGGAGRPSSTEAPPVPVLSRW